MEPKIRKQIHAAHDRIRELCDMGQHQEALELARSLDGPAELVDPLIAIIEIDAGEALGDREVVISGIKRLKALGEDPKRPGLAYNCANGLLALWQLGVRQDGVALSVATRRADLQQARDLYATLGSTSSVDQEIRCQALVNLGNSMDGAGRHIDAIRAYEAALAIDPNFAMAHGNRGLTFLHRAGVDTRHRHALVCEAVESLDAALAAPDDVIARGGPSALEWFRSQRALIAGTPAHSHNRAPIEDAYLAWCHSHELFVHSSHGCIGPDTEVLDSIGLGGMVVGVDDKSQQRLRTLQDALNALLRDYIAVRYLAWMSLEHGAPARQHAADLSARSSFYDTLTYGRWGVGTGLATTALSAATNLLDKTASVVHLYLGTGRDPRHVYFKGFYLKPAKKGRPAEPDPGISQELAAGNLGLLALCDLAGELERPTPLNEQLSRRHAATHRALAVHEMLANDLDDQGWVDRIEVGELRNAILEQLGRGRAALLYLADMINQREKRYEPDGPILEMPSWPAVTEENDQL